MDTLLSLLATHMNNVKAVRLAFASILTGIKKLMGFPREKETPSRGLEVLSKVHDSLGGESSTQSAIETQARTIYDAIPHTLHSSQSSLLH